MKIFSGTVDECEALAATVDRALGYPKRATQQIGGGRHVQIPATWDGTGQCPPGWAATHEAVWPDGSGNAVYRLDDAALAAVQADARLDANERALISSASARRSDVADKVAFVGREQKPRTVRTKSDAAVKGDRA